jgi:hypothetical protein
MAGHDPGQQDQVVAQGDLHDLAVVDGQANWA